MGESENDALLAAADIEQPTLAQPSTSLPCAQLRLLLERTEKWGRGKRSEADERRLPLLFLPNVNVKLWDRSLQCGAEGGSVMCGELVSSLAAWSHLCCALGAHPNRR